MFRPVLPMFASLALLCACGGGGGGGGSSEPPVFEGRACVTEPDPAAPQAPAVAANLLFLITEDQGMQMGALGTPGLATPNEDALAAAGAFMTNSHVTLATCTGSKSSLFTGFSNHNTGAVRNVQEYVGSAEQLEAENPPWLHDPNSAYNRYKIRSDIPTLIEVLRDAGFYTGLHNKFHIAPHTKFPYTQWDNRNTSYIQIKEFIAAAKAANKRWFLSHVIGSPHRPYPDSTVETIGIDPAAVSLPAHLPDTAESRRDWSEYLESIERGDRRVGDVLRALDESGEAANTIVVFMGDHGPSYHRGKLSTYGFGLRSPLVFKGPGIVPGVRPELFSNVDMMVTMLDLLGYRSPETQGVSFRRLLTGTDPTPPRTCVVGETNSDRSIFDGRYRLIETPISSDTEMPADNRDFDVWRNRVYRHIAANADTPGFETAYRLLDLADRNLARFDRPATEFYDTSTDPWEINDRRNDPALAAERERLALKLDHWRAETSDTPR